MTPQISFYEVEHFRVIIKSLIMNKIRNWSIFENVDASFIDQYFKILILNIDNNPEIDYAEIKHAENQLIKIKELRSSDGLNADDFEDIENSLSEDDIEDECKIKEEHIESEVPKNNMEQLLSTENENKDWAAIDNHNIEMTIECKIEKRIKRLISEHPEIEEAHQKSLQKLNSETKKMTIVKYETIVRDDGIVAKCAVTKGGQKLLIRSVDGEIRVTSKNISGNWY